MALLSWPGDLCCAAGMRAPAVTLVNLSPKWNPNLTPSAAALNTPDLRQCCKTDGSLVKAGSREKHRRTEYRQIARAYCTDILGNNLEPVNSGSQALFLGLKIKRKQTFFSGWKLTWHIYPEPRCYRWSPKSWILLFFICIRSLSCVWQVKMLKWLLFVKWM